MAIGKANQKSLKNSVVAKIIKAITATIWLIVIPFLKPNLLLTFGTNKELMATKRLVHDPIKANSDASIRKL